MTDFKFASVADVWPPGTVVGGYLIGQRPPSPSSTGYGPPSGPALAGATVAPDGSLTFSGLADSTRYTAYALGHYRDFSTPVAAGTGGGPGVPGPQGPQGLPGPTGAQGPAGPKGDQGAQGPLGPQGSSGTGFVWRGTWSSGSSYIIGDVVFQSGVTYYAKGPNSSQQPPNATYWDVFPINAPPGPQGPTGAQGPAGANGAQGPQGVTGATGPAGPTGAPGPPGPAGQNAVAVSDAVRGQSDRFYREVGGILAYTGAGFAARNDSYSRPQNIDLVTTSATGIKVKHDTIGGRALVKMDTKPGPNLRAAGISAEAVTAQDLKTTDVILRRNVALLDTLSNPGDGTAWVKELGLGSQLTATGLTNVSSDFAAYVSGLSGNAADFLMSEASGAVLDDNVGANDGTVVGTVTYGVTGGVPSDPTDKAIATPGTASNELTVPLAGITQAAFSILARVKLPTNSVVPIRDATGSATPAYAFGTDGGSPAHLTMYVSGAAYITSTLWSAVADNNWHDIVLRKNGANASICVDGVQVHSTASAGSTAISSPWHIGRNGTVASYTAVTISRFTEFSRSLTDAEVKNIHEAAVADGLLHVAHASVGSTRTSEIKLTSQGALRPVLDPTSVTATGFAVKFFNAAGTQIKVADTGMALGVAREVRDAPVNPTALTVPVIVQKTAEWDAAVRATSPQFYARLGESSGTNFNDEIGTNDGTSTPTVTLGAAGAVTGDANTGVTFDGAQGRIAFANPALTGQWSMSMFVKPTGPGTVGSTDYGAMVGWGVSSRVMVNRVDHSLYVQAGGGILTTAPGTIPDNVWTHIVFIWDGTTEKAIINGQVAASVSTANVTLNAAFFLGVFTAPSTNYSFKGDLDDFILWNRALTLAEAQQLWADAVNGVLQSDRATDSQIEIQGLFETLAPTPTTPEDTNVAPTATALPASDIGGGASVNISLAPYRAAGLLNYGPSSPWCHRALPTVQATRDAMLLNGLPGLPLATSANWKSHMCAMFGFDPVTGADTVPTQGNPSLYLRAAGEFIYVVPDSQPMRMLLDRDTTVSGWATQMNNYYAVNGGAPVPADAMPHFTGDRYAFIFQPSKQTWWTLYNFIPQSFEEATSTMELTSTPSSGGFFLEFDYQDPVNQVRQTFFCQTPILYNDTAAAVETKMNNAKTASGVVLGATRNFADSVACSGGPLNVAPIKCAFQLAQALQPVTFRYTNNFLSVGGVHFTYENADPWTWVFLSAVTGPGANIPTAEHHLPYMNTPVGNVPATAAATHIDWMPMVIDWDEYNTAYNIGIASGWNAAGTDLGHIIPMSIGNCGTGSVYPATAGDGTLTNDGSKIMEGALITFPTTADSSKVDPVFMPIFNTIKRYGVIPIDKTGGGAELIFRNWLWPGVTRPFPGPSGFNFQSQAYTAYMRTLPWHQAQIIDPAAVAAGW